MKYPEQIKTIKEFGEKSFKEKGSVFTAQVYYIENENEAVDKINSVKKKYFDATHHCYAYKLIDETIKYSDAGEPAGTAGIRILNAIEHFDLSNLLVIVIRYFGGTKLGVGPLGKTYYTSAFNVINESNISTLCLYQRLNITSDFENVNHIHRILSKYSSILECSLYEDKAKLDFLVRPSIITKLVSELNNAGKGKILCTEKDYLVYR